MRRVWVLLLLLPALVLLPGCKGQKEVTVSREALGTVVSITAYGDDEDLAKEAVEGAFAVMSAVAAQVDAYNAQSAVSQFNANPYQPAALPPEAVEIVSEVTTLGVAADFSPTLLGVSRLYNFGGDGAVPSAEDLALAVQAARAFTLTPDGQAYFTRIDKDPRLDPGAALAPGLDFGGAAKGLALDLARQSLRASGKVSAAIITSGSSTVTFGTKPDGTAWRIGVEDPRDPKRVVATFAFEGEGALSTSGDYQRYFEKNGRRYHHILHPATGLPVQGIRSLTVAGSSLSGLDSDILSTALFVSGPDEARSYANDHKLALFVVDSGGRVTTVPAPKGSGLSVAEQDKPKP